MVEDKRGYEGRMKFSKMLGDIEGQSSKTEIEHIIRPNCRSEQSGVWTQMLLGI